MTPAETIDRLEALVERGRYSLTMTLTETERALNLAPTYGGKATSRHLTDSEFSAIESALAALREQNQQKWPPFVRLGCMTESNGCETWVVTLAMSEDAAAFDCLQVYSDVIKGRAEYERDRFRHFFGLGPEPNILSYDTEPNVEQKPAQSAREKAAREAAGVCKKISADAWHEFKTSPQSNVRANPYTEGQSDGADSCEAAIFKHFNLEAK